MRKSTYYKKGDKKPDHKYGRIDMGRFINYLMKDGKKSVAEDVFYTTLEIIKKKTNQDPIEIFEKALNNASPIYEVVSRRIGGANYQIPREVRPDRKFFLATHWIINAAYSKRGSSSSERLAEEIIAASKNEGEAVKKKQNTHKMAEANRAFASFLR